MRRGAVLGLAAALALGLTLSGSRLAASQTSTIVAAAAPASVPWQEPWDAFWDDVPMVALPLSAQEVVAPKGGRRLSLSAGAVHDGKNLFVILEWPDRTVTESMGRTEDFTDAAAVQFPAEAGVGVPAICMGATDAAVNIWQWKAAWQADVERGSPPSTAETNLNTVVDSYPFHEQELYQPARALGNPFSVAVRDSAADNLVAGGFGTLTADPLASVAGWGRWRNGTWRVVLTRPLEVGRQGNIELGLGMATDVAFAVWDGAAEERDGMKSVSAFARLNVSYEELPEATSPYWWLLVLLILVPLAVWLGLRAGRSEP
jgi:DMSO reductase family type II enzyme heme b subunit